MTPWKLRPREEKALLNPGFCSHLLWHAARGYSGASPGAISFEESFLILPLTLHRETREAAPRTIRTSLAVWLLENPLVRGNVASRARLLVPTTKEAMTFGGTAGLLDLNEGQLRAEDQWRAAINRFLAQSSDEVRDCAKWAAFLGKWFARTGDAATVFALMGLRP